MSFVEDSRKLLQDFVAPEVRSINVRIDGLVESMKLSLAALENRFDESDRLAAERHAALLDKLESTRRELSLELDLALARRKIEQLELKQQSGEAAAREM